MQALQGDPSAEWRMRILRGEHGVPLPGSGSGRPADIGDGMRGRPFGAPAPESGPGRVGRALRGGDGLYGTPGAESGAARAGRALRGEGNAGPARTGEMMGYAMDQLRKEGVPEDQLLQAAAHLVGQATMESGLDPNKIHDQGTGYGIYGARDPKGWGNYRGARRSEMVRWLEANGFARNSAEGQMREMAHQAMSGRYPRTKAVLMGRGTGDLDRDTNTITGEFESPAVINRRSGAVQNAFQAGPEGVGSRAPVKVQIGDAGAGGEAFAADFKRRQQEENTRRSGLRLGSGAQSVLQAGAGASKVEVNGTMTSVIRTRDPNTTVSHSASGNLFREIVQSRGRQMQAAGGD